MVQIKGRNSLMKYTQKPGEIPAFTGIYQEIYFQGGYQLDEPNFCTIEPGDNRLPPTKHKGNLWLWVTPYIPNKK